MLSRGLVPRDKPAKQRLDVGKIMDAHDAPQLGPTDVTIVDYASSVSGFHELEVMGKALPVKRPRGLIFAISLALGLMMTAALAIMLLRQWTSPQRIAIFAGVAILVVMTLSALMAATTWRKALRGAVTGASWGLIASLGCPFVALAWSRPDFRASILEQWPGFNQTLHDALDDPSDDVAAMACRKIIDRGDEDGRTKLLPVLTVRTKAAELCLSEQTSSLATGLAETVAKRWTQELMIEPEDGGERAQQVASAIVALPLPQPERDLRLLGCAFTAPNGAVRAHCADILGATIGANTWNDRLKAMVGVPAAGETARGVLAMAFDSNSLRPEQRKLATRVDASAKASRWYALEFVADAVGRGSTEPIIELTGNLDGKCTDLDVTTLPQSRETWFNIAVDAISRRQNDTTVEQALCAAAVASLFVDAVENAQSLVAASIRTSGAKEARAIDAGWLDLNKHMPQTHSDLQDLVPEGVSDADAREMMRIMSSSADGQTHPVFLGAPAAP